MDNNTVLDSDKNIVLVKYSDTSTENMIKYCVNMLIVLLLLWWVVRNAMFSNCQHNKSYAMRGMEAAFTASMPINISGYRGLSLAGTTPVEDASISIPVGETDPPLSVMANSPNIEAMSGPSMNTPPTEVPSGGYMFDMEPLKSSSVITPNFQPTDTNYKYKDRLEHGMYGDVITMIYDDFDDQRTDKWKTPGTSVALPNAKKYWMQSETPYESNLWQKENSSYKPTWFPRGFVKKRELP
jgi:hypothetical protein